MADPMGDIRGMRQVRPPKKTLAAIVGAAAAAMLFTHVPAHESGRTVQATIAADGTPTVRHITGKQYLKAYRDIVGIPTACDGITRDIKMGQSFTEAQCTAMLERELLVHAQSVMKCSPGLVGATPSVIFAAVSLAYNVGVSAYCGSTAARRFNARQYAAGCDALLMWNKAGGRVVRGLQRRREHERAVCLAELR